MMEQDPKWYALFVRSRHEFVAAEQLRKRGIEAFLPSVTRMRRWSDRRKAVTFPLFPGYVFVRVRPCGQDFLNAVTTHGSVCFVCQEPGRPTPVDPQEIDTLRRMLCAGGEVDVHPHLCTGAQVKVRRGPLAGAVGMLVRKQSTQEFLVNIEILGRSIGMQIDADDLGLV
jgi:transcriptional antiterminator NusG